MSTPAHQSTAEAILAQTGPLGFDADDSTPEPVAAEEAPGEGLPPLADDPETPETPEGAAGDTETPEKAPSWSDSIKAVEALDPKAADLMRKMQADYTRKTQAASKLRKETLRERRSLLAAKRAEAEAAPLPEYDPWKEESINARIEREVSKRLAEALEPMQKEAEVMQAEEAYHTFVTEHPEFESDTELRSEVQTMLEANGQLDLETAYWAAQGKLGRTRAAEAKERENAKRSARRRAAGVVGSARRGGTSKPTKTDLKSMGSADILALARAMNGK